MHHDKTYTIGELRQLLTTLEGQTFKAENKAEAYDWIEGQLKRYRYDHLRKKERNVVRQYIKTYTGYSTSQLTRLIASWTKTRKVRLRQYKRHKFAAYYTREDIVLLAHVDTIHGLLSGPATRCILHREYTVFGQAAYERLSHISAAHIYNLRKTFTYHDHAVIFTHTKGNAKVTLGERHKPEPNGSPGYLRVDSVHQGDAPAVPGVPATDEANGKGVYHINYPLGKPPLLVV